MLEHLRQVQKIGAARQLAWPQSVHDWMLYLTAHSIKSSQWALAQCLTFLFTCFWGQHTQETTHIQVKVFPVFLYSDLSVFWAITRTSAFPFQLHDYVSYYPIFLIVTYYSTVGIRHHLIKDFPTWFPVSCCSKQCPLKDICINIIIITQWISVKTIVFNEGIWDQMNTSLTIL